MYESLALEIGPRAASVWFGLALGLLFGAFAEATRFCLRRALVGPVDERASARSVWLLALAVAVLGTQVVVAAGWIGFDEHRYLAADMPVLAIALGGLIFGAGAVLSRGCISRLTVLTGTGNLRALTGLLVFAIAAHATLKGVLAPLRVALGSVTVSLGDAAGLSGLPGGALLWTAVIVVAALAVALRNRASLPLILGAVALGALVPLGWAGTGFVLYDDFDPIVMESLSFTSPWAETLFWSIASTSVPAGFGTGLIGGALAGALAAALLGGRFRWEGFSSPSQMGRSLGGAALMGVGGVLAGGCSIGAGLSGVATLSVAALLALAAIATGMLSMNALLVRRDTGADVAVPAE